jgi:hypothetical protein
MSSSQSGSSGSQPGQDPAATAIDPRFTNFLAALEQFGYAYGRGGDHHKPDPTRVRAAQDYDVIRGLLGRTDAPRPLQMERRPAGGGGGGDPVKSKKTKKNQASDNVVVVKDPIPASASLAVVESLDTGAGPLHEEFDVKGEIRPTLTLTEITAAMPISRVEIYDDDRNLVAFGPSAAPIA